MRLFVFGFSFYLISNLGQPQTGWAQDRLYRLDAKSGMCQPVDDKSLRPRAGMAVQDFPRLNEDFLKQNHICRSACKDQPAPQDLSQCKKPVPRLTCLTPDRIDRLIQDGALPRSINSSFVLTDKDYKSKVDRACLTSFPDKSVDSLKDFERWMQRDYKTYPIETKMLYTAVQATKKNTDNELEFSRMAMKALEKCLQYDVKTYSDNTTDEQKLSAYQQAKNQKDVPPHCERLWDDKLEYGLKTLPVLLQKLRLNLMALKYLDKPGGSEEALNNLASQLENEQEPSVKDWVFLKSQNSLKHRPGDFYGHVDSIWKNSAKEMASPTPEEEKMLRSHLEDLKSFAKKDGSSLTDALKFDYFRLISENPILMYFENPNPNSKEILSSFQKHQQKWNETMSRHISDPDYLQFGYMLQTFLEDPKQVDPQLIGDYCVLLWDFAEKNQQFRDALPNLLIGAAMAPGGIAALGIQGTLKATLMPRLLAFVGNSKQAMMMFTSIQVGKSWESRSQIASRCSSTYMNGNGLCDINKIDVEHDSILISAALFSILGGHSAVKKAIGK